MRGSWDRRGVRPLADILGTKIWPTEPGVGGGRPSGVVEDMSNVREPDFETQGFSDEC